MNKIFRKAITVLSGVALVGATIGGAIAASYPSPFTSSTAVVYGANAAPTDYSAAMNILSNLNAAASGIALTGGAGVTETEVPLGAGIVAGKITATLTDSKISSLLDDKISWDDGGSSGADDYNYQEQIIITNASVKLLTTFNDNDFVENVALTNDKGIEYRWVFDDAFNVTGVGDTNADTLYLTILGKRYEVSAMTNTTFTVTTSEEVSLGIGQSYTFAGQTFTVDDVYSDKVQVNGEIISTGTSKKINGLKVYLDTVGYHSNAPELSKVILKIGTDITKTYSDGEEYVGENEDDPEWVWTYSNPSVAAGYIGVKYNYKQTRDTDDVVYAGGSYIFPENFAEVKFDGLTSVSYEDFKIYFDDSEDLWNSTDLTSTANTQDAPVLIIEAVDGRKDAITLTTGAQDTSKIYLRWANSTQETQGSAPNGSLEVFFSDVDGTIQDSIKPRFSVAYEADDNESATATIGASDIGDITVGDTVIAMSAAVDAGNLQITFTDNGAGQAFIVDVGGVNLTNATGSLKWFGGDIEATDKEAGLAGDLIVGSTNVGTYDNDIMTANGQIIKTPEANLDNDRVIFSVPSDRVYGIVSVLAGGIPAGEAGAIILKDTETAQMSGKNLVVVGGSAINAIAAELLGSAYSEGAFTSATSVNAGKFLIQSFSRSGKTALLVAGYNAADTEKAATYLLNNAVDTSVGKKYVGTSTTQADLVVA